MSDGYDGGHGGHDGHGHGEFSYGHDFAEAYGELSHGGDGHGYGDHGGHITTEALMLSHSHCHDGDWGHYFGHTSMDSYSDFHSNTSHGDLNDPDSITSMRLESLKQAKSDPLRRYFGAHIVGHGYADVPAIFTKLAKAKHCLGVGRHTANFRIFESMPMELTDWDNFDEPFNRKKPPAGWYPGAKGMTKIWRQYWQVGKRKNWWNFWGDDYVWDRTKNTYIQVSLITWIYSDVGDFETRIDISVITLPILDQSDKQWGWKRAPFLEHQKMAETIVDAMFKELTAIKPSARIIERRKKILEGVKLKQEEAAAAAKTRRNAHFSYGTSGADLDTLIDPVTEEEALNETSNPQAPPGNMTTVEVTIPPAQ